MRLWHFKRILFAAIMAPLLFGYNNCGKYNFTSSPVNGLNISNGIPSTPPTIFSSSNCTSYPYSSSTAATDISFNEARILDAYTPSETVSVSGQNIAIWYSDERSMTLGIRQVNLTTSSGTTTTNFPITALMSSTTPGMQLSPQIGASIAQGGVDVSLCPGSTASQDTCSRPMYPAMFVTDITTNTTSTAGDWQFGGTAYAPTAIFGTWKGAVKNIDMTQSPPLVSVTVDKDPDQNNNNFDWNLGPGIPAPSSSEVNTAPDGNTEPGFGTLVSWDVGTLGLTSGHQYRIQFMVHDGDQNQKGGDVSEACVVLTAQ